MNRSLIYCVMFIVTIFSMVILGCSSSKHSNSNHEIAYVPNKQYQGWHMTLIISGNNYRKIFIDYPSSGEFKYQTANSTGTVAFGDGYFILEDEYDEREKWYTLEYKGRSYISNEPFDQDSDDPLPDTHLLLVHEPAKVLNRTE